MRAAPPTQAVHIPPECKKALWLVLIVGIVAIAVYANALPNGLHVDDQQQIVENPWIKDPASLGQIFSTDVWQHAGRKSSYYRPMMYVLYMAVYLTFGLEPFGYHLLNVLLHAGASIFVALIALDLSGRSSRPLITPWVTGVIAGALFATHPIHTEAVAWAAGIADLSYSFFCLMSFYLYMQASDSRRWVSIVSAIAFFAGALCKEPALTLPLALLAYDALLRAEELSVRRAATRLAPFAVAIGVYLLLRFNALGSLTPVTTEIRFGLGQYVINVLFLFSKYLEALVLPVGLNFWHVFRPLESLASPAGLRAIAVVASFVAAGIWAVRKNRAAFLGLIMIVVPLLPTFHVSALNQGLENAFAERYLYLPSFGFVLAITALGAWFVNRRPRSRKALLVTAGVVVLLYSTGTVLRNPIWRDSYTLWADVVDKSPASAVAHQNLGFALLSRGQPEGGRRHLDIAHRLDPGRVELLVQNALAYAQRGRRKQAILEFHNALVLDPVCFQAHYGLGVIYESQGWVDLAAQHYRKVVEIAPTHAAAHNNLGILLAERGHVQEAFEHFSTASRLEPDNPDYRANLDRLGSP